MDFERLLANGILAEESPRKGSQAGRGGDNSGGCLKRWTQPTQRERQETQGRQKEQESGPAELKGLHAPGRYFNQRTPSRLLPFPGAPLEGGELAPPEAHIPSSSCAYPHPLAWWGAAPGF